MRDVIVAKKMKSRSIRRIKSSAVGVDTSEPGNDTKTPMEAMLDDAIENLVMAQLSLKWEIATRRGFGFSGGVVIKPTTTTDPLPKK